MHNLCFMPSKFIKKYNISYTLFSGGNCAKISRKLNQTMMATGVQDRSVTAVSGLIITALKKGTLGSREMKPSRLWPQPSPSLAKAAPGQGHINSILFALLSGPLTKP